MKKLLITLMVVLSVIIPASAQVRYRGFVDAGGGISTANNADVLGAFMFTTTHGIQITDSFFTGLGLGVGGINYRYGFHMTIPFYAQGRYDFSITHGHNWYITLKGGGAYLETIYGDIGYYIAPATGMRFVLSHSIAMNLGVRIDFLGGVGPLIVTPLVVFGIEF